MYTAYTPETQIFIRFALRLRVFELQPIFVKLHRMISNDLGIFNVKSTEMHTTYTAWDQIFIYFTLQWPVFKLQHNLFIEWPQNDHYMLYFKSTDMHTTYILEAQIFIHFALRWAVLSYAPFLGKVPRSTLKWRWHVQGQKYQYACYIHHTRPNFHPFHSKMSVELRPILGKSAPNDPKWPWHVQSQKYP